ncbi:MAG: ABC transporter permease [Bacteroidia bacterium]|jgi:lipopolysaccharide transport system permease protein|nr:ABC transporter permease [Bacteroidia bacterium]
MEKEITPKNKLTLGLPELWQYRELFYFFTWRDIKVKYKQATLGFAWAILQPLFMMIVFTLFFGKALKVPSDNIPYPIFVYSGLLLWNVFSSGLSNAANSMVSNANIIKKIYFPRLIIPISSILVSLFDFLMALLVFIAMLIYYQPNIQIFKMLLFMPLGLLIATFTSFGGGTLLAALNIKYRDFQYVIPFFIQILLFVTPVIYPVSILPALWMKYVMALNPMYGAIELFRSGIINKPIDINLLIVSMCSACFFFIVGIYYFRKTEAYFADLA